ncbi:MAG: hypothetical protein M3220_00940 [Chloroflexota bacterium]|nr:hypothetical protein [Chloroflexota bacterium]
MENLRPGSLLASFKRSSSLVRLFIVGAIVWSLFAWLIMPQIISAAYSGRPVPLLSEIMTGAGAHPISAFLARWNDVGFTTLVLWGFLGVVVLPRSRTTFAHSIVGVATAGTLGAIRLYVCLLLIPFALSSSLFEVTTRPGARRLSMGIMDLFYALPGFEWLVTNPSGSELFRAVTVGLLLLAAIGWKTRWTVPLAALLYLALVGVERSYTWFNHAGLVPFYVLLVLSFTRCGDGWSLDRWLRKRRGQPVLPADKPHPHYAWGRYAVWLVIVLPYAAAGLSKLRNGGWMWWDSTNFQAIMFNHLFRPEVLLPPWVTEMVRLPPWIFAGLGLLTVLTELGMVLLLFSRRARLILPLLTVAMHLGIAVLLTIHFWDLILLQALFYNWGAIARRIRGNGGNWTIPSPAQLRNVSHFPEQRLRAPLAIFLLVALFLTGWMLRLEVYPLTAMQMFSGYDGSGVIRYVHPYQTDLIGQTSIAPLRDMGVSGRGYRRLLQEGFVDADSKQQLTSTLHEVGEQWNGKVHREEQITQLEVVLYEWDFVNDRGNPDLGHAVDHLYVPLSVQEQVNTNLFYNSGEER